MWKFIFVAGAMALAMVTPAIAVQKSVNEECKKTVLAQPGMKVQGGACGPACAAAVKRCIVNGGRI